MRHRRGQKIEDFSLMYSRKIKHNISRGIDNRLSNDQTCRSSSSYIYWMRTFDQLHEWSVLENKSRCDKFLWINRYLWQPSCGDMIVQVVKFDNTLRLNEKTKISSLSFQNHKQKLSFPKFIHDHNIIPWLLNYRSIGKKFQTYWPILKLE